MESYIRLANLLNAFLVPTPTITATTVNYSLVAGSNTTLMCNVLNYSYNESSVVINITWFRNRRALSADDENILILSNSPPTFTSQLSLSPLKLEDENITCSATASLFSPQANIDISLTALKSLALNIGGNYISIYDIITIV